jgi:hypothetical protein
MQSDDDLPPDPRLQPSIHPRFRVGNKSKNREKEAARVCSRDDDDSYSSLAHSSELVKAPYLVDAEQHGEILHPSSRIHPKNGCFRELLQFQI